MTSNREVCFSVIARNGFLKNFGDLPYEDKDVIVEYCVNRAISIGKNLNEVYEDLVCEYRVEQLGVQYAKI